MYTQLRLQRSGEPGTRSPRLRLLDAVSPFDFRAADDVVLDKMEVGRLQSALLYDGVLPEVIREFHILGSLRQCGAGGYRPQGRTTKRQVHGPGRGEMRGVMAYVKWGAYPVIMTLFCKRVSRHFLSRSRLAWSWSSEAWIMMGKSRLARTN